MLTYRDASKYNRLRRVAERVELDLKRAIDRDDMRRAQRHANRVYLVDAKLRGFLGDHIESFRS